MISLNKENLRKGIRKMDKSQKLKDIILSKYKSIREFSKIIGIPNSTLVTALDNGIGGMAVDKVIRICEELNIDIKTFDPIVNVSFTTEMLVSNESDHIKNYRLLNENGKKKVDEYMIDLINSGNYTESEKEYEYASEIS